MSMGSSSTGENVPWTRASREKEGDSRIIITGTVQFGVSKERSGENNLVAFSTSDFVQILWGNVPPHGRRDGPMKRRTLAPIGRHVFARGTRRLQLFHDDEDYLQFIIFLKHALSKSGCVLWAFTLMSNHYHLVLYG